MATSPVETPADDGPSRAHNPFYALERFGFPGAVWRGLQAGPSSGADRVHDEEAILESEGEQFPSPENTPDGTERASRAAAARAIDFRLQRDLRAAGLL